MESSIYCDGSSRDLTESQALKLSAAGIIKPHPGRGTDVGFGDWILAAGMEWEDIGRALNPVVAGYHDPVTGSITMYRRDGISYLMPKPC